MACAPRGGNKKEGRQEVSQDDVIVTTEHLRGVPGYGTSPGFCLTTSRTWFRRHGLDFRAFLKGGVAGSVLEATGDPRAVDLVEHARQVEAIRGQQ